jgi:outer membrane protein, multidrug efflux system
MAGPSPLSSSSVVVPASWSASAYSAAGDIDKPVTSLTNWWRRFDDAKLVSLIDMALQANTSVSQARGALAQSRALWDVQSAGLFPGLNIKASAQRNRVQGGSSSNAFNAGFDASWEPDVFGGVRAGIAASKADALASAASLGDVQVSIAAEVAVDYIQLRGGQAREAIARSNLASQIETLQLTQWRRDAGLLTALEVEQARSLVEQTRAQIPLLQTASALAEHSLAVLTHHAPADLHDWLAACQGCPVPLAVADLVLAFPLDTLRQRPDVRAAESRVSAAAARVSVADAARFPNFALSGTLGLSASTLGGLGNGASLVAGLLGSVAMPLFDAGMTRAQVRAQQAALVQTEAAYDAVVLAALKDVEDNLVTLQNDRDRLQSLLQGNDAAQNALQLALQRYQSGLIDFQVVLDTQRAAFTMQDSVLSARTSLGADHVRLYKALGGGWDTQDISRLTTVDTAGPSRP